MRDASRFEPRQLIKVDTDGAAPNLYPHQIAAYDALSRCFEHEEKQAGLLVIPTGGGKTVVAAKWLLEHWVSRGGRVLWLAHRKELVRQAMRTFADLRAHAHPKEQLGLIAISSDDCQWSQVSKLEDAVFCSTPTAVRESNLGFIDAMRLGSGPGLFVVLDEAHHAPAPQIAGLLRTLARWKCPLLGLTATPVRMSDLDQRRLAALFDANLIYEVKRAQLAEAGVLAIPRPETVQTKVDFERDFTEQDKEHLARFGEVSERVLEQLAAHAGRNKLIVEHYRKGATKYGPTIVFAANTHHAHTLATEFQRARIDADYVTYTRGDSAQVLARYRAKVGPQVLINVEMLTEGFDAPHTRTVFLARPTKSEALLTQMIGRALRGPKAGGNREAHLVTFVDTWSQFTPIDSDYVLGPKEDIEVHPTAGAPGEVVLVPIELVNEAYRLLQTVSSAQLGGVFESLPHGWYVWDELLENDVQRRLVMVYEHQLLGYREMLEAFPPGSAHPQQGEALGLDLRRRFFSDCSDPLPRWLDLVALVHAQANNLAPQHYTLEDKKRFDPKEVAAHSIAERHDIPTLMQRTREIFQGNPACRLVYKNDFRTFQEEVMLALTEAPARPPTPPELVRLVPEVLAPWPSGDGMSLIELRDVVLSQKIHFPKGAPVLHDLSWSKRPVRTYFGCYRQSDKCIVLNSLLNSPDIPRFVLEFLLYHELLHADMPSAGHNAEFRERERRFVPSPTAVEGARAKGILPGSTPDAWRVQGDIFLDTLERHFRMPGARHIGY